MGNETKIPMKTAYVVLNAEGDWHTHKDYGFYLVSETEDIARQAMIEHNGAEVVRVKAYFDGTGESETVALNQ
jgi:hypothetical protein